MLKTVTKVGTFSAALVLLLSGAATPAMAATSAAPDAYIDGAIEFSGLTEVEAIAAWNDEELRNTVIIDVEVTEEVTEGTVASEVASFSKAGWSVAAAAAATRKSKSVKKTITLNTWAGEAGGASVTKTFLYDGSRTYADDVTTKKWANAWQGFHYLGMGETYDRYASYNSRTNGKHISFREVQIADSLGSITTFGIRIEGRYNGTSASSASKY